MEVTGTVKKILDLQTFDSGFRKRELVLLTQEQYPQQLLIEFLQDKVSLLNDLKTDDQIRISINLRGREWITPDGQAKYFNSISGWRLEKVNSEEASINGSYSQTPPSAPVSSFDPTIKDQDEDDLPF